MTSSTTFSPSSFLSFFDFPVVAATSANQSSHSSHSSHSHTHRPASLFDLSCLQPDVNSPPIVTSPVPAAAPHSHFFPEGGGGGGGGGHVRSGSGAATLSSSSSSPSLRSSLPSSSAASSCTSPRSPPGAAGVSASPPAVSVPASTTSSSSGHGPFAFELSSLTSWLDSLFPAEDTPQPQDSKQQHTDSYPKPNDHHHPQPTQESSTGTAAHNSGSRRPCRPRLSQPTNSPPSSASLVRALSSHPKKPSPNYPPSASSKPDISIAHPASAPMSIARTSSALPARRTVSSSGSGIGSGSTPPSPPVDLDETVASLLAGGGERMGEGVLLRGGALGGGALSPLPEVQLVESLTPDSPSQVLTLDVHRTDELQPDTAAEADVPSFVDFGIAGIPVGQPLAMTPTSPPAASFTAPRPMHAAPLPPSTPPPASLLSSALLEADLDYFHVDRETAIAVEQLTTTSSSATTPHSPDSSSADDTELTWDEEAEDGDEDDDEGGEGKDDGPGVVRLRGESMSHRAGRVGRTDEDDWEVCRVQEGGGGGGGGSTDDDYEML